MRKRVKSPSFFISFPIDRGRERAIMKITGQTGSIYGAQICGVRRVIPFIEKEDGEKRRMSSKSIERGKTDAV